MVFNQVNTVRVPYNMIMQLLTLCCRIHKTKCRLLHFNVTGIRQFVYCGLKEDARVFVGVSGINSLDWIISDIAVSLQSMVLVPIHTSLVSSLYVIWQRAKHFTEILKAAYILVQLKSSVADFR